MAAGLVCRLPGGQEGGAAGPAASAGRREQHGVAFAAFVAQSLHDGYILDSRQGGGGVGGLTGTIAGLSAGPSGPSTQPGSTAVSARSIGRAGSAAGPVKVGPSAGRHAGGQRGCCALLEGSSTLRDCQEVSGSEPTARCKAWLARGGAASGPGRRNHSLTQPKPPFAVEGRGVKIERIANSKLREVGRLPGDLPAGSRGLCSAGSCCCAATRLPVHAPPANLARLQAVFRRRKNGLLRRAMELSVLTDSDVVVLIFNGTTGEQSVPPGSQVQRAPYSVA